MFHSEYPVSSLPLKIAAYCSDVANRDASLQDALPAIAGLLSDDAGEREEILDESRVVEIAIDNGSRKSTLTVPFWDDVRVALSVASGMCRGMTGMGVEIPETVFGDCGTEVAPGVTVTARELKSADVLADAVAATHGTEISEIVAEYANQNDREAMSTDFASLLPDMPDEILRKAVDRCSVWGVVISEPGYLPDSDPSYYGVGDDITEMVVHEIRFNYEDLIEDGDPRGWGPKIDALIGEAKDADIARRGWSGTMPDGRLMEVVSISCAEILDGREWPDMSAWSAQKLR